MPHVLTPHDGRHCAVPSCRDPFVNTPLIPVPPGPDGIERFWISTYNHLQGCTGVLLGADGSVRIYHFDEPKHNGFYSAVAVDAQTLWLCGDLATMVRLDLATGEYTAYPTGAPYALVFQGITYDPATGKLLVAAFPPPHTTAVSFDTRRCQTVKVYADITPDHYARTSMRNRDGSYTMLLHVPGVTAMRWQPQTDELVAQHLDTEYPGRAIALPTPLIQDDQGAGFLPGLGWFDGATGHVTLAAAPREAAWFAGHGETAYGTVDDLGTKTVLRWHRPTNQVSEVVRIAEQPMFATDRAGERLYAVTVNGEFTCHELATGALRFSRRLPVTGIQHTDCLCRIDRDHLLGTPFITQRFWLLDLATGKGTDCGRAAPGGGEILQTWKLRDKVYLASYGSGTLLEFDPRQHAHYPENPRLVAAPPHSMRPVGGCDDGERYLWYCCNAHYGHLGSTLIRYDTTTGQAEWRHDPLPQQALYQLRYDRQRRLLLSGATYQADCGSAPPASTTSHAAAFDPQSLACVAKLPLPAGTTYVGLLGPLAADRWLLYCHSLPDPFFTLVVSDGPTLAIEPLPDSPVKGFGDICYAHRPGYFLVSRERHAEIWHVASRELYCRIDLPEPLIGVRADAGAIYVLGHREVYVFDDVWARQE